MFVEYPVWVISVAVLVAVVERRLFPLVFVVSYDGRSIFLVQYTVIQSLESVFRLTVRLQKIQ